ncbi:T9SS type A sorting domain-containing protein [Dyadobacter chenwenxiniae]|uniref:T9SS type A sorting domain-containing protein n=1 Tax=Dyadobacter chenwenxiniae TaxID=2906456 RepID=A0A9X1PVI2_9BACT|nr:T9SS type A sorting domain-containing protein [Dyadobacter chenwenxiniae]MCF0065841.1 T9SS type A sorting domain-containing protein [Dyadobacter chenwenxiniae]UON84087.1 T9SS type A sorting domain-containing protein [Dyadobacter chenwenxiniae]
MKLSITIRPTIYFTRALLVFLLFVQTFAAHAQIDWTSRPLLPDNILFDVAFGAGKYVAVGQSGMIRVSTDGITWNERSSPVGKTRNLRRIIYANGFFVVVGDLGTVMTSTDGLNWYQHNSGTDRNLYSIAYGGGTFVAVGMWGCRLTSSSGIDWTNRSDKQQNSLYDVVYGNGLFVSVGDSGILKTSSDNGATWTARVSATTNTLYGVSMNKFGRFVAVGIKGTIISSAVGMDWTSYSLIDQTLILKAVASNPNTGKFVVMIQNKNKVLTSADGVSWNTPLVGTAIDQTLYSVRYLQNQFLATGEGCMFRSSYTDGATWVSETVNHWKTFICGSAYGNGRLVLAGGSNNGEIYGTQRNLILTTLDGINYKAAETIQLNLGASVFTSVTFGKGLFVAVGTDAIIQTSTDGYVWSYSRVEYGQRLEGVAYGGGKFVAVGDNGLILYSSDGKSWIKAVTKSSYHYKAVAYANGMFVLVGLQGVVATSTDGNQWTFRASGTPYPLESVTYGNGRWIAVGLAKSFATSFDGKIWVATSDPYSDIDYLDVVYENGQFVICGRDGKLFRYVPGVSWTALKSKVTVDLLTITYGNGMFITAGGYQGIQTSPGISSPAPAQQSAFSADNTMRSAFAGDSTGLENFAPEVAFKATTYPNPVLDQFSVNVEGANGETIRLQLSDVSGRTIFDKVVKAQNGVYQEEIPMAQKQTGLYLMRVSTPTQTQTVKVLKK